MDDNEHSENDGDEDDEDDNKGRSQKNRIMLEISPHNPVFLRASLLLKVEL